MFFENYCHFKFDYQSPDLSENLLQRKLNPIIECCLVLQVGRRKKKCRNRFVNLDCDFEYLDLRFEC